MDEMVDVVDGEAGGASGPLIVFQRPTVQAALFCHATQATATATPNHRLSQVVGRRNAMERAPARTLAQTR